VLIDSGLDYVRSPKRHEFGTFELTMGEAFEVTKSYFWGTNRAKPLEGASMTVTVSAEGREPLKREVQIDGLPREGRETIVDLGVIDLECN
jgi:hypothetical protein